MDVYTFTSCVARDDWDATAADGAPLESRVDPIPPPNKIRDVQPVYPPGAEKARIQGVIIIQAQVSRGGCVRSAAVIRTIPELDVAALAAVSGWEYTPLLVDGQPKRVEMTVTVNFTLQ